MLNFILITFFINPCLLAGVFSVCAEDNRKASYDLKVGRLSTPLYKEKICTATLISKNCAISAGHCFDALIDLEFNTPFSINGEKQDSKEQDKYKVHKRAKWENYTRFFQNRYDWVVFKVHKNKQTGFYPGEKYGYYKISKEKPAVNNLIYISGYGMNDLRPTLNYSQQKSSGEIKKLNFFENKITYDVDTMGGHSGAAIVNKKNEIIGIHTDGGCDGRTPYNFGVTIYNNKKLQEAISKCIKLQID